MSRPLPGDQRDKFVDRWCDASGWGGCASENADELDGLARAGFRITHDDFTYHPDDCDGGCEGTGEIPDGIHARCPALTTSGR